MPQCQLNCLFSLTAAASEGRDGTGWGVVVRIPKRRALHPGRELCGEGSRPRQGSGPQVHSRLLFFLPGPRVVGTAPGEGPMKSVLQIAAKPGLQDVCFLVRVQLAPGSPQIPVLSLGPRRAGSQLLPSLLWTFLNSKAVSTETGNWGRSRPFSRNCFWKQLLLATCAHTRVRAPSFSEQSFYHRSSS